MTALFAQIVVCPLCGREAPPTAIQCGHCGAELSKKTVDPEQAEDLDEADGQEHVFLESGKLDAIGWKTVVTEFNLGRKFLADGDADLARAFFRNALALEGLAKPDESGGKRAEAIRTHVKKSETFEINRRHECPVCGGSATMKMKYRTFSGGVEHREVQGKLCPRCGLSGFIVRPGTIAQRLSRLEESGRRYEALQKRRGYARVGLGWVPPELNDALTVRQQAALNRALAAPCASCGGAGATDCRPCKGLGEIKCGDCEMGLVTVDAGGVLTREKVIRTEKCKTCGGRGALRCEPCGGKGRELCDRCKGTGQRAVCGRCDAAGVTECRRCGGTGESRGEPCAACAGSGATLCSACRGEGRTR